MSATISASEKCKKSVPFVVMAKLSVTYTVNYAIMGSNSAIFATL